MTKDQFYNLFVNANCLAELALRLGDDELADLLESIDADTAESSGDDELGDLSGFENLDMNALDGLPFFGDEEVVEIPQETDSGESQPDEEEKFSIDSYMQKAYSYEDQIRERVDRAFASADLAAFGKLLESVDKPWRPITERQTGADIEPWLESYKADDTVISNLVVAIRQLDN